MEDYVSDKDRLGAFADGEKKYFFYARSIMELIRLRLEIFSKASFTEEGHFRLSEPEDVKAAIEEIQRNGIYFQDAVDMKLDSFSRPCLEDSTPVYTDIENAFVQEGMVGPVVEFYGKKRIAPELGRYIGHVLNGSQYGVYELLSYPRNEELMPIDVRVERAKKSLENAKAYSSYYERKKVEELIALKESGKYFDIEQLKKYHEQACDIVELQDQESGAILTLNQFRKQRG